MSVIDDLIQRFFPGGVKYVSLNTVAQYSSERMDASKLGEDNFVGVDNLLPDKGGRTDANYSPNTERLAAFAEGDTLIGNIRPYLKKIWLADRQGGCSGDVLALHIREEYQTELSPVFLYYLLSSDRFFAYEMRHAKGAKMPRGDKSAVMKYRVPLPPLEVQEMVVRILDSFTSLEAELEAELEARKKQYEHYLHDLLLSSGDNTSWQTFGDIGKVKMCKRVMKNQTNADGDIPFFKIGTFGKSPDAFISRELFEKYRNQYPFPHRGDVLISAAGTIGRAIPFDGVDSYFQDSNIVWIDNDQTRVINRYLYYWCRIADWSTDGGTIKRLYNSSLLKTKIMVPSLSEQRRVVSILDRFDALVNDLSSGLPAEIAARRKQYEFYRDQLLSFKELAV